MRSIRRKIAIGGLLLLIMGFLLGSVFPQKNLPWSVDEVPSEPLPLPSQSVSEAPPETADSSTQTGESDPAQSSQDSSGPAALNPKENFPLLNTACTVVRALQQRDYTALSSYVHPQRGLTITPYSTVDLENDLNFTPIQVKNFAKDTSRYSWGLIAGQGEMITMTAEEFISAYLFSSDYTQAPRIGIDRINISGNALENVSEAYPDCRFVDFTFPGTGKQSQDWCALKLVFLPGERQWQLVGLIHSQWTP